MSFLADFLDPQKHSGPFRFVAKPLYSWSLSGGSIPDRLLMLPPDPWTGDAGRGRWLINRTLEQHGAQMRLEVNHWAEPSGAAHAFWGPCVHGFEWLRDLRAVGGDQARRMGRTYMQEWMDANPRWHEGGWAFPVAARRISSWLTGYDFFCASADDDFLRDFYVALTRQIRHLERAEPLTFFGCESLNIIKALIYSGLCFEGGEARLEFGLTMLDQWLGREIDGEGMHVSRSPALAVDIMRHLIDIRGTLVRGGLSASSSLQSAIDRMAHALRLLRMPDQKLAVFHGSQEGDPLALDTVFRLSGVKIRRPLTQLSESGFDLMTRGRAAVIVDCGGPAPDPLDSHSHASPLAFEMAVGRDRMIVNCGTRPEDAAWSDYLRATAAHSTLSLDDRNSCEIRPDGHVGRAPVRLSVKREQVQGGIMLTASHDGYAPLNGIIHGRRLFLGADGNLFQGEDSLVCESPLVKPASFAVRFHLHPRVQASLIQGGAAALLRLPSGGGWRFRQEGAQLALEPSIYCGAPGLPRKTLQLVLTGIVSSPQTTLQWNFQEEA